MSSGISRRQLLRTAGRLGLAAGTSSVALGRLRAPAAPASAGSTPTRLRKCVSLGNYGALTVPDGHPNDYRLHGNREYIRDVSGTRWVKLWVSWAHLQEELRPATRDESWAHLAAAPGGQAALRRLDRQIRAINEDSTRVGGMGVILTLYQEYPSWSSTAPVEDGARAGKPLNARVPDDVSPDSPWGWFVSNLCARYAPGAAAISAAAAAQGHPYPPGNPDGAFIDALEVCNEPNYLLWPQAGMDAKVAGMITTAAALSTSLGGPAILGPGTSDFPDHPHETPGATDWLTFSKRVLAALGRTPPAGVDVGWSHHNYLDVSDEVTAEDSRARAIVELLGRRGPGFDRRLWLTEGGYDLYPRQSSPAARLAQARKLERNYQAMAAQPGAWMWTQHTIADVTTNNFKSGLRDEFTPNAGWGAARPAFDTWARLPGSPAA